MVRAWSLHVSVILSGLTLTVVLPSAEMAYCPIATGGALNWTKPTDEMGDTLFPCANQFKSLWCCARGYTHISWSRRLQNSDNWESYPWPGTSAYLDFEQQQLTLRKITTKDEGYYRCVVSNSGQQTLSHQYYAAVNDDCSCTNNKPIIGRPNDKGIEYYRNPGSSFTSKCSVSFGPGKCVDVLSPKIVRWYKALNRTFCSGKGLTDPGQPKKSEPVVLYETVLNIVNITDADYGFYCCSAFDGLSDYDRIIELKKGPVPSITDNSAMEVSVSVVAPIIGISVIVLIALWVFRLDILLFCHVKRGRRSSRGFSLGLDYQYDTILINSGSDGDNVFVERLLMPHLEKELRYEVFLPRRDLDLGYIDNAYIDALRSSKKIIIVVTQDFLSNPLCGNIHDYVISDKRSADAIFIQHGNIPRTFWGTDARITNIEVLQTAVKNAKRSWLGLGKYLTWRENYETASPLGNNIPIINTKYSRQITQFWKQLFLYLPLNEGVVPDQPSPPPNVI